MFVCRAVPIKKHFFSRRYFDWAGDAEADPGRICKIPDTLGQLWILLLPTGVRTKSIGRAKLGRVAGPTTAAHAAGIERIGPHERVRRIASKPCEVIRHKLIRRPLHHVSVHVKEAPGVW